MEELNLNLREKVLRGGTYLVTRHLLGVAIAFANLLILTRLIGPKNYGLYAAALGMTIFLGNLSRLGIDVYLIRQEKDPSPAIYNQAFTVLFCSGMGGMLLGVGATPLLQRWYQNPDFIPPFLVLLMAVFFHALTGLPMAKFERNLNYKTVLSIDLTGQIIFCIVSLVLAIMEKGVWAPVIGYLSWQLYALVSAYAISHTRPRFLLSLPLLREMIGYGLGYSASLWIWQLRFLVNPLIVGRFGGPEAVGFVALTIRVTDQLSFIRGAVWQLSIPTLSKLQGNYRLLKKITEEAMTLQVLFIGPFLMGFALLGPWLFPHLFGERWRPILTLYPFISVGILLNVVFNMHSSVLYVLKRNWDVALFHLIHLFLFSLTAFLLVPPFDILGYALAEMVALLSYLVIHIQILKFFNPSYSKALPWMLSFIPPLFATLVQDYWALLLWLPLLIVLLLPAPRKQAFQYFRFGMGIKSKP